MKLQFHLIWWLFQSDTNRFEHIALSNLFARMAYRLGWVNAQNPFIGTLLMTIAFFRQGIAYPILHRVRGH